MADIAAAALGWDEERKEAEKANYRARIAAELAAEEQPTDALAAAARLQAPPILEGAALYQD